MSHDSATASPSQAPAPEPSAAPRVEGIAIGVVVGFDHERVLVQLADDTPTLLVSHSCARPFDTRDLGTRVALCFVDGDPTRPLILDKVVDAGRFTTATLHERKLVFEADVELELRCGSSSLTMTRDGRVIIQGKDLLSRASSVNRIRGGVIHLN